jgi:hypothetical protein
MMNMLSLDRYRLLGRSGLRRLMRGGVEIAPRR